MTTILTNPAHIASWSFLLLLSTFVVPGIALSQDDIRRVDFANYTYMAQGGAQVRLRDGEAVETQKGARYLAHVNYGDVTGDGQKEAIVRLGVRTGGSAMPNEVYIFAYTQGKARLLWMFGTGDRADGGYRNVYADNGALVVELYGKGLTVGDDYYRGDGELTPACCPKYFTRTRYEWVKRRFRQGGSAEVVPNPEGHGSPIDFQAPTQ